MRVLVVEDDPKMAALVRRGLAEDGVATKKTYFTMVMSTPFGTSDKPPVLYDVLASTSNPGISKTQG